MVAFLLENELDVGTDDDTSEKSVLTDMSFRFCVRAFQLASESTECFKLLIAHGAKWPPGALSWERHSEDTAPNLIDYITILDEKPTSVQVKRLSLFC